MKIKAAMAGIILPVFFTAGILISAASGYWKTENSREPARFNSGDFTGEYDPADIRGSYSFSDLEKAFDIPVATLAEAFGINGVQNPSVIKIKEFEEIFSLSDEMEIGTDSMRLFIALYKGLPYDPELTTALPEPAWNLLRKESDAGAEELAIYESRIISLTDMDVHVVEAVVESEHSEESEKMVVKGKTLFSDLLELGLRQEQIEEVLGVPMGARAMAVRDFCVKNGIEFSSVKISLQELLDNMHN